MRGGAAAHRFHSAGVGSCSDWIPSGDRQLVSAGLCLATVGLSRSSCGWPEHLPSGNTHTTPHRPSGQNKAQRRPGGMCGAQTCEAAFGVTMKGFATVNDYGSRCRKTRRRQLQSSDSIGCLRHHALLLLAALTGGRGVVLTGWFRCSCKADLQLQSPVAGPDRSGLATVGLATVLLQRSR